MCAMMQKLRTLSRRFMSWDSEPDAVGQGDARPRGSSGIGTHLGAPIREVGVDVGVGHLEEVDRDGPPDVVDLLVHVRVTVLDGLVVRRGARIRIADAIDGVVL